jgi:hypothetical protein
MNKEQILSLIRHILTSVGIFFVIKGDIDEGIITEIIGSVIALVSVIWGIFDKSESQMMKKISKKSGKMLDN